MDEKSKAPFVLTILFLSTTLGCSKPLNKQLLHDTTLPNLENLTEITEAVVTSQYGVVASLLSREDVTENELGEEFGKLGQILLAFEFPQYAEPALLNAQMLLPEDTKWPFYLGRSYQMLGRFQDAIMQLMVLIEHTPDDFLARTILAELHLESGQTDLAKDHLEIAIQKAEDNPRTLFLLGQVAAEEDDYEAAISYFESVLSLQSSASQVFHPLGLAYRNLGKIELSQRYLNRYGKTPVTLNDPRDLELELFKLETGSISFIQGMRHFKAGRHIAAIPFLTEAVNNDSTNITKVLNLGVAFLNVGEITRASETMHRVLRLDSMNTKALYNIGYICETNGDPQEAAKYYKKAVYFDARNEGAHYALAELYRRGNRCMEALPHYHTVLDIIPGSIQTRLHQAYCYIQLNDYKEALTLLETGLEVFPDHLVLANSVARLLAASPDSTIRDGNRALDMAEQQVATRRRTETIETLAMAHAELHRFDDALEWQMEAIESARQQNDTPYVEHLINVYNIYRQQQVCRTPWPDFIYTM